MLSLCVCIVTDVQERELFKTLGTAKGGVVKPVLCCPVSMEQATVDFGQRCKVVLYT
jgi:hypothetical protein